MSIGIAHNILLAKLATRHAKPAGVYHLISEAIPSFIHRLSVEDFPYVGYSTKSKVEAAFKTTKAGELLDISKGRWKSVLGEKTGEMMWGYLRGIDSRRLEGDKVRKSVSAEMNVRLSISPLVFTKIDRMTVWNTISNARASRAIYSRSGSRSVQAHEECRCQGQTNHT